MDLSSVPLLSDAKFLAHLKAKDIEVRMHGGKLRISAPAGTMDEATRTELVRRKASLLTYLEQANSPAGENRAPLSYAQERLWMLEQFHPGNFAYNIPETSNVDAYIDPALMQQAIDYVVRRHAVLRTCFREDAQGGAWQHILDQVSVPLQVLDFTQFTAETKDTQLQRVIRELSQQPFDLRTAPLVRFYIIRMERVRFIVFINIHHIISDRWSMRILYRELLESYRRWHRAQN